MWIGSKLGFYSIVRKPTPYAEELFHVRAPLRPDLESLLQATRLHKTIEEWPEADDRNRLSYAGARPPPHHKLARNDDRL